MGTAKATLLVDGEPLAPRSARLLAQVCDPVLEVGPGYTQLTTRRRAGTRVAGRSPRSSPAPTRSVPGTPVLLLACDLPFVSLALLTRLVESPGDGTRGAARRRRDGAAGLRPVLRRRARTGPASCSPPGSDRCAGCSTTTAVTYLVRRRRAGAGGRRHARRRDAMGDPSAPVASTHDHRVGPSCSDARARARDGGRSADRTPGPARHRGADGDPAPGPAGAGGAGGRHDAHPGQRLRARGRVLPHRGAARRRGRPGRRCGTASTRTSDQEYNVVTVTSRRPVDLDQHRRVVAASSSCGICGKTTLDEVAVSCAAGRRRARSSPGPRSCACPTCCATPRRSSTRPAGSTRPGSSRPPVSSRCCARTSAGTTRSTSSSATA